MEICDKYLNINEKQDIEKIFIKSNVIVNISGSFYIFGFLLQQFAERF